MPPVRYDQHGAVAVVTLDDAATRNALSPEALDLVERYALTAGSDPDVRLLVVTGADGIFCSGAAIRDWETAPPPATRPRGPGRTRRPHE